MANEYYQKAGEYPYIPDVPDTLEFNSPTPYSFYVGKDGKYPYINGIPDVISATYPPSKAFYGWDGIINNGYPFLELPTLITEMRKPLPNIMYKPNQAKEIKYTIMMQNSDNTIVISDYENVVII